MLLTTALYLIHLRSVRARYAAVLDERVRIAREWHDTLLSGLAAVSLQLDVAIHNSAHSALSTNLKSMRGMLRYCSDEARRAVSYLRSETLSPPDLERVLRATLEQATAGTGVQSELHAASGLPQVKSEVSLHLSRICQEALSNAIQHGSPSKVVVTLDHTEEAITLTVQDNGVGIHPSAALKPRPGHFGILGMRERMERLGGQLEISSAGDRGTLVIAKVPIVE
jgi:signal transduction histidine kinase